MWIPLHTGDIIKEETFILRLILQPAENNDFTTGFNYYNTAVPHGRLQARFSPVLPLSSGVALQFGSTILSLYAPVLPSCPSFSSSPLLSGPTDPPPLRGPPVLLVDMNQFLDI